MPGSEHENPSAAHAGAVSRAVSQFWQERANGRQVSVDELLETSAGTVEHDELRRSVIKAIASQAATYSGEAQSAAPSDDTLMARALAGSGPIPLIDGYDLVSCLGRGGMGAVYEGYQHATGRRVAIKFMLDAVGASDSARKRFEREVEVVARLQHPGIVSVIDSGVRRGRYFYAMDYVEGWPLDGSLIPGRCDVRKALELVTLICDAVDYAHQRGVLHRDLKPSNIIVDDQGLPHLLDFGLAKIFDPAESDGGNHGAMGLTVSGPGQLLGTVAYMSPEQAEGRHDETSVRTDVYALAAIAYELLTGHLPCVVTGSLRDTLDRIQKTDPAAPSTLRPGISRDLDAVLLKALEKSPEARYVTVGEFAADLRRALANEPVLARRVNAAGRAWRWVKRNRAVSTVTAAAMVTLVIVSSVLVMQIIRESELAALERDLARENFERLRTILESADPERSPGGATVLQLLDTATTAMDEAPPERDLAEAQIREVLGNVYRKLGEYAKARDHQQRALEIRELHADGRDDPLVAEALHNLAATLWWDGAYADAERLYARSLGIRQRLFEGDHRAIASSMTHLAACRLRMGKYIEAREMYQQVLRMRQRMYGGEHEEVAQALNNLAKCLLEADEFDRAEDLHYQALDMIRKLRGDSYVGTAAASQNLGDCLLRRSLADLVAGDAQAASRAVDAAVEAFERALEIRLATFPSGHHLVAASLNGLARAELQRGNILRAADLARQSIDMYERTRRSNHPDLAIGLGTLGAVLATEGKARAAVVAYEQALAIAEEARPPAEAQVAQLCGELAEALSLLDEHSRAENLLLRSFDELRRIRGEQAIDTVLAARRLVSFYADRGENERALMFRSAARLPDDA